MKKLTTLLILLSVLLISFSSNLSAKPGRKLPVGAYLKSAKIDIISNDKSRYPEAIAMIDTLFMFYGHHAEALNLMGQVMVDYIDDTPDPHQRLEYVKTLVAYNDSLHQACGNKEIKKSFKKGCQEFIEKSDSVLVKYWREFYNSGVEQLGTITEKRNEIAAESDEEIKGQYQAELEQIIDSCITNMKTTIAIDPSNEKSYVGIGSLYEKMDDYENAIIWLKQGLDKTDDRKSVLLPIAYDYINSGNYCDAIPFLKEYVDDFAPEDTLNMGNLVICYNNCQRFDEAYNLNKQILSLNPANFDALKSIGNYFSQLRAEANKASSNATDDAVKIEKQQLSNDYIDSALVYYSQAVSFNDQDDGLWGVYATFLAVRERWAEATPAFAKLTELVPNDAKNWVYLGDCYIRLKKYNEALIPYEKAAEVDPSDKDTWTQLVALYEHVGDNAKKTEAEKKVKELGGN